MGSSVTINILAFEIESSLWDKFVEIIKPLFERLDVNFEFNFQELLNLKQIERLKAADIVFFDSNLPLLKKIEGNEYKEVLKNKHKVLLSNNLEKDLKNWLKQKNTIKTIVSPTHNYTIKNIDYIFSTTQKYKPHIVSPYPKFTWAQKKVNSEKIIPKENIQSIYWKGNNYSYDKFFRLHKQISNNHEDIVPFGFLNAPNKLELFYGFSAIKHPIISLNESLFNFYIQGKNLDYNSKIFITLAKNLLLKFEQIKNERLTNLLRLKDNSVKASIPITVTHESLPIAKILAFFIRKFGFDKTSAHDNTNSESMNIIVDINASDSFSKIIAKELNVFLDSWDFTSLKKIQFKQLNNNQLINDLDFQSILKTIKTDLKKLISKQKKLGSHNAINSYEISRAAKIKGKIIFLETLLKKASLFKHLKKEDLSKKYDSVLMLSLDQSSASQINLSFKKTSKKIWLNLDQFYNTESLFKWDNSSQIKVLEDLENNLLVTTEEDQKHFLSRIKKLRNEVQNDNKESFKSIEKEEEIKLLIVKKREELNSVEYQIIWKGIPKIIVQNIPQLVNQARLYSPSFEKHKYSVESIHKIFICLSPDNFKIKDTLQSIFNVENNNIAISSNQIDLKQDLELDTIWKFRKKYEPSPSELSSFIEQESLKENVVTVTEYVNSLINSIKEHDSDFLIIDFDYEIVISITSKLRLLYQKENKEITIYACFKREFCEEELEKLASQEIMIIPKEANNCLLLTKVEYMIKERFSI